MLNIAFAAPMLLGCANSSRPVSECCDIFVLSLNVFIHIAVISIYMIRVNNNRKNTNCIQKGCQHLIEN